jgi:hypothetical protein
MQRENKWQDRFRKEFVREDGLLDIGKYDEEILEKFIQSEITRAVAEEGGNWSEKLTEQEKRNINEVY